MTWMSNTNVDRLTQTAERAEQRATGAEQVQVVRPTIANMLLGGAAGGGLGLMSVGVLSWGMVPGMEALVSTGPVLPLLSGVFLAGVGVIAGSFIDLLPASNAWRDE